MEEMWRAPCRHHRWYGAPDLPAAVASQLEWESVIGLSGAALTSKGGRPMSVAQTADRIDYWIRRCVHTTDFSLADLRSAPHATRRSRANGARQSKSNPAPDRS